MQNILKIKKNAKKDEILSPWKVVSLRLKRNKLAMVGLYTLVFMVLVSIFGPMISPHKMDTIDLYNLSAGPSLSHPLGTDDVGRDVLTRLLYGGRISLTVGFIASVIAIIIGSILGAVAGFYGRKVDTVIMRLVDIFMCVPSLPLMLMLSASLSDYKIDQSYKIFIIMFIIGVLDWPGICRIVRGQILTLREQEFMLATEALGLRDRRRIFKHLLPNTFSLIIVAGTLEIGGAILYESVLSFLGLGVTPPTPSWGQMVQVVNDQFVLMTQPWRWASPGICILVTVMAINLFGDGLRDALDPKLKR